MIIRSLEDGKRTCIGRSCPDKGRGPSKIQKTSNVLDSGGRGSEEERRDPSTIVCCGKAALPSYWCLQRVSDPPVFSHRFPSFEGLLGRDVLGRFLAVSLAQVLGSGGFGAVYRGTYCGQEAAFLQFGWGWKEFRLGLEMSSLVCNRLLQAAAGRE